MAKKSDSDGILSNDLINQNLQVLQKELGQLKSYTDDIGKSRDASAKVIDASDRFVKAFQKNTKDLVTAMEASSSAFQQTCTTSSDQLHQASKRFDMDIERSMKLLDVLGKQLDATAERVQQMTGEIRQMDIPGRFTSVSKEVQDTEVKLLASGEEVRKAQQRLESRYDELAKQSKTRFMVNIILGVFTVGLLLYLVLR